MPQSHKPFRVRRSATLAAAVSTIALLAGCASGGSNAGEEGGSEEVVLRVNWWGSDTRHAMTQEVIDQFEAENPNISIQPEFSTFGDYFNKLSTTAASNDLPDVMHMTDPYMYQYIDNGQLLDLATVSDSLSTENFSDSTLFGAQVDGGLYGVPAGVAAFGIVADPEIFEQAGIPVPDDETWTWDEYIDMAAKISEALPGVAGAQLPLDEQMMNVYLRQQGEDFFTEDGSDLGFTAETAAEYWTLVEELRDSGGTVSVEAAVEAMGTGVEQSPVATGTGATQLIAVPQLGAVEEVVGHPLEVLLFPGESEGERPGSYTKPGIYWSVAANSEHPEEAAKFIDYVVNSTEAAQVTKFDRGVPANSEVVKGIEGELTTTEKSIGEYIERVNSLNPDPFPRQNLNAGPAIPEAVARLQQEVLFDRLTPQEAADQLVQELTAAM